jgi:hypothetical protein
MLGAMRRDSSESCISDLRFDAWFARELDAPAKAELLDHVRRCRRCRTRLDALFRSRERFSLQLVVPAWLEPAARRRSVRRNVWLSCSAITLAACALLAIDARPRAIERAKGQAYVGFFVKHGSHVQRGSPERPLRPGDHVRFTYTTLAARYLAIMSVDRAAHVSIYFPEGARAALVEPGVDVALPSAVELDESLGEERIVAVFCEEPLPLQQLTAAVASREADPRLPGCAADSFTVTKEPVGR